jgi:hypothetical protein
MVSMPNSTINDGRPRCPDLLKDSPSSPSLLKAAMTTFTVDSLISNAEAVNAEGHFFDAADFQALAFFNGFNEVGRFQQ